MFFRYFIFLIFIYISLFAGDKITLRLQWKHQFEFAGFYAAKELGYYKNAGLDVDILEYENGVDIIEEVKSGKIDFGIWGSGVIEQSLKDNSIVLLANYFKRSPLAIIAHKDIKLPSDLKNKKLMIPKSDYESANYIQMFKRFELDNDDIDMVNPSFNIQDFIDNKVDAVSVFLTNEPYWLEKQKVKYNVFDPSDYGVTLYDVNLFTSLKFKNQNPELVKAFTEASNKGWSYALEHNEEISNLILTKYNSQNKSKEHLLFEVEQTKKMMLPNIYPIGSINENQIKRIASLFSELGMIKSDKNNTSILNNSSNPLNLTDEELDFIKKHPVLKVASQFNWAPYDFVEDGNSTGYSSDFTKLVAKKAGFEIEFVQDNWNNLLKSFKNKQIDIMQIFAKTQDRKNFTLYLDKPVIKQVYGIISSKHNGYTRLEELNGKKVAMGKGWYITEMIKKLYPQIQVIEYDSTIETFNSVLKSEVDASINGIAASLYYLLNNAYTDLIVKGDIYIGDTDLFISVRNDYPLLKSILDKAQSAVTNNEKNKLYNKWNIVKSKSDIKKLKIDFSSAEQEYINSKKEVTYCFNSIYKPIEFLNQDKEHDGMTRDILELISENSGLKFIPQKTTEWSETLKKLEKKECEMIFALTPSPAREKYMIFTDSYLDLPEVLVNKLEASYINGVEDIVGQKIGILKGDSFIDIINKNYKGVKLVELDDPITALQMVVNGSLDGFIEFLPTLSLRMGQLADKNLKIAGKIDETTLNIAAHKSEPILLNILQKSLKGISIEEKKRIKDKWMALKVEKEFDYSVIWKAILLVFIIVVIMIYINYKLKAQVKHQVEEIRSKDSLILEQSKHAAMGELIANIAHQWRQPLANLNGLILNFDYENEKNILTKEKIEDYLTQIEDLSLHMSNTIEDFSNYFSPKKEKKEFIINILFTDIRNIFKYSFIKNNINLIIKNDKPISINSYYAELLQILLILINNSKDAFLINKITEPCIFINTYENDKFIILEIEDNAGGIKEDIINHIFEPYFTTKNKSQGTGLGLHIVKTLLENSLKGNIEVKNIKMGVKFIISLER